MLTGLYVIFIPVVVSVLNRRFKVKPFVDAIVCLAGMMIFFGVFGDGFSQNIGDILTIVCAAIYAAHFVLIERRARGLNVWNFAFVQLAAVAALSAAASLLFETRQYASLLFETRQYASFALDGETILSVAYLGALSSGYAAIIQIIVQTKVSAITVSMLSCLESVFALTFSILFYGEQVTYRLIIGSAVMIAAMVSSVAIATKANP
jgi:drug/metabolite transporter (DMT)-like permease